jgi:hypothetical protein
MRPKNASLTLIPAVLAAAAAAVPAQAEVTASGPTGFIVKIELPVAAAPGVVYDRFVQIGRWWNEAHSYSGKAANLTLENRVGGCFCETLADGGFVRHMDVVFAMPGKALRLSGGLGPLQPMGASGVMAFQFKAEGTGSRLSMIYTVSGFADGKALTDIAPAVDGVLSEQLTRLKRFVETGKPTA